MTTAARYTTFIFQSAQAGNANGNALTGIEQFTSILVIAAQAAFTGTLNFEVSDDGTTWFAVNSTPLDTGTKSTTAAFAGAPTNQKAYIVPTCGMKQVRVRTSGVSAGSTTVTGRPSDAIVFP